MNRARSELPATLYRADQVRALDRYAIDKCGIPGLTLMERAGAAAFAVLCERWPKARYLTVLCGMGNNGGDGYVVARLAHQAGFNVTVMQVGDGPKLKGDARAAAEAFMACGLTPQPFAASALSASDVLIDALLGTGLDREVSGELRAVIEAVNSNSVPVLAIDIPSGLHADTGRIIGAAVEAKATVSFIGLKQGMFTGQGPDQCGAIYLADLDVPEEVYSAASPSAHRVELSQFRGLLTPRRRTAHKGHFGHVLVVGGEHGYAGAARMAAEAAGRMGAGLISLATRPSHAGFITISRPEIMCHGVEEPGDLTPLVDKATVIAVGPGLSQSPWARRLFHQILKQNKPLVVDADGLNLLAAEPLARDPWVLTPHPGEAARLLGSTSAAVQADRFQAAGEIQRRYGGVCVLKGAGTVIATSEGGLAVCQGGNPGMASGGMGDVLTGVIAGLLAQGLSLNDAAHLGVCLHASAGDLAAREGERGLLASDLMPWLRQLVNPVRRET